MIMASGSTQTATGHLHTIRPLRRQAMLTPNIMLAFFITMASLRERTTLSQSGGCKRLPDMAILKRRTCLVSVTDTDGVCERTHRKDSNLNSKPPGGVSWRLNSQSGSALAGVREYRLI